MLAYPALLKYTQKASDVNRLNKNEVCAIALRFFGTMLKEADKKEILVATLQQLITARPSVIRPDAIANPVEVPLSYAMAPDSEPRTSTKKITRAERTIEAGRRCDGAGIPFKSGAESISPR